MQMNCVLKQTVSRRRHTSLYANLPEMPEGEESVCLPSTPEHKAEAHGKAMT